MQLVISNKWFPLVSQGNRIRRTRGQSERHLEFWPESATLDSSRSSLWPHCWRLCAEVRGEGRDRGLGCCKSILSAPEKPSQKRNPCKQTGYLLLWSKSFFSYLTFIWKEKSMGELLTSNSAASEFQVERTVIHWLQMTSLRLWNSP